MSNKMFKMTKYTLLILVLLMNRRTGLSQVTVFPGEAPVELVYQRTGDFGPTYNAVGGFSTNFNRARGIISVGAEVQSDNYASWEYIDIHFYYNGNWVWVLRSYNVDRNTAGESAVAQSNSSTPQCMGIKPAQNPFQLAWYGGPENRCVHTGYTAGFADRENNYYVRNFGNLQRYNGFSYLPRTGNTLDRAKCNQDSTWSLQFDAYSSSKMYPVYNGPDPASNVQGGYDVNNFNTAGNIAGIQYVQYTTEIGAMVFNISNIPPEMLSATSFKVRSYSHDGSNTHSRICITTYNNENPMKSAPVGLTASNNVCGGVKLSWSNSSNTLPAEDIMYLKNVIFRNGNYLATVNDNVTTYTDATALQDSTYNYTVRHVAFTTLGKSYYQSNPSNSASGNVKPRPDIPISPKATSDRCTGEIEITWQHNGTNPKYFKIERSTSSAGPYTVLTSTLAGTERLYLDNTVTRGLQYFYKISSISDCNVGSAGAAGISGISPADPNMATGIAAVSNTVTGTIDISWTDNANNETKYEIVRTDDEGNTVLTQVNANATSYADNSAAACRLYTYKVRVYNDCVLSGITSTTQAQATLPPPNLSNTFDATHKLTASKGYFSNRVELSWGNNNGLNIDIFKIYRKQLGTALDSVQIAAPNAGSGLYVDNTADARVFYRYTIVGVKSCNGSDLLTNISSDIGFRNPTGLVSGHVEYNGGIAVSGAKVFVQTSSGTISGNSLDFNPGGTAVINDDAKLEPGAQMRCEFWIKPTVLATGNIISKANAFSFSYNGTNWVAGIYTNSVQATTTIPSASVTLNNWNHIAMVYDGSSLKTFVDGVFSSSVAVTGSIDDNNNNLVFGSATTDFLLDEFRLIGQSAVDSLITIDANRILNGDETGFKCNLHFNEAVGDHVYDVSKVGNFYNGNHAVITNTNVTWSSDIPTSSQLSYFGMTNSLGNYVVLGIQYLGTGENFNIVPQYQTHSFSPNSRSVYVGDASNVYNNQDFTDISSFPVTGTLFYENTTCPVPDAVLSIDGLPVVKNGDNVKTDANGTFSVSVPIGNHFISINKQLHDMKDGRYPVTGTHNFQAPISGLQFIDSTKVTLVGRVVGGLIEKEKAPGMGRSVNNIGVARLRISTATSCYFKTAVTNSVTGEYLMRVPPMVYKIDTAFVINNPVDIGISHLSNTNGLLDLTTALTTTVVVDTLFDSNGGFVRVDSIKYNKRLDFIYRSTPVIDVTMMNNEKLHGEDTLYVGTTKLTIKPETGNFGSYGWGPMDWPVYNQGKIYFAKIHANEIYINADNNVKDTVPLSGNISITNQLVDGSDPNPNFSFDNGVATYSFVCGSPNTASLSGTPDLSYTKDIQVVVVPDGAASVSWYPNQSITPANKNYHAIIIGKRTTGTGLATQGPEKVDFILRDPPGSGSSATWSTSNSISKSTSIGTNFSSETGLETSVLAGVSSYVGFGKLDKVEVENDVTLGLNVSTNYNEDHTITETISSSFAVSTRDDADNVGTPADIFIGRSRNWLMGPTTNIELIDASNCNGRCFGPTMAGKRMAKTTGFTIDPDGIRTRFAYTKNEIETVVIPTLEAMRNSILVSRPYYTVIAAPTHSLFGSNNDDPLWGAAKTSTNPEIYDASDTTGSSYIFRGFLKFKSDTVRILNSQIAIWKRTLAQNEKEKYLAKVSTNTGTVVPNPNYSSNPFTQSPTITIYPPMLQDNFTLGSAVIANSYQIDNEDSRSETYEVAVNESLSANIGAEFFGVGFKFSPHVSFTEGNTEGSSNTSTTSNSIEYTLTDGDPGDVMSVDVYRYGLSNIFITRGGQTMCPYEDAVVFNYYDPNNPDAWISSHSYNQTGYYTLSNATIQREMPNIAITPAVQYNIPSNQPAVYQIVLSNQSPLTVNNDIDLQVRVDGANNPNGAVCKIDGQNADNIYTIPSGGSLIKTLTIERGPIEIEYDSLMVIFSSACSADIADTAYVSVHFIPTCTDLALNSPVDNFVVNNNNHEMVNVIMDSYNYNFGAAVNSSTVTSGAHPSFGFEKIGFEFKPANSSQWLQIQDFFKYPNAVGSNTLYPIPQGQVYTQYQWTVTPQAYADGNYEIRAVSYCYNKDGSYATIYSPVHSGVMDRINPHPFGTPSPGDGILDPNDDISIQFNEAIDISSLSYAPASNPNANFDIRGVLNGTNIRHSESLNFDGASNYVEVSGGASLQKRSFTIEFWAKLNATGINQTAISQGSDPVQRMAIGFDNTDKLVFTLGNQAVSSTNPVTLPGDWHHYAVVYDYANTDAMVYIDGVLSGTNNNFAIDYIGSGKLVFGKAIPANNEYFGGNIHDVRLWNDVRTISEITITMNKVLNQNQSGLVYNWRMDEADGTVAADAIRSRNANIYGATWEVNPNGNAVQFDGVDDNIQITSGNITITKEMDFTLEFWFNSTQPGVATLFANGKGDGIGADSLNAWNIEKDASGIIHVRHKGLDFVATNSNFFDGKWHHFSLIMNRSANLSCYVDGNLQNSVQGVSFNNLSGAFMYLGARGYQTGSVTNYDNYFNGKMDEFRLWNTARKTEQIKRDKQNRMLGDEYGLVSFMPFENYAMVLGTPSLTPTFNDQSQSTLTVTPQNGVQLISQTPTIKLPRPVQAVNYNYSLNNDKIILTTTTSPDLIENVTLDITVKNAYDMHGNKMQSPKTWIAYINKNQVKWQDAQFDFEKTVDSVITFVAPIVNSGGAQKAFTIGGIPSWMTSSTTSGNIAPNSVQNVTFTIPAGQSVGDYTADLTVTTDFNYDELLQINLKVKGLVPNWTINTANYQYQMNLFGQVKIDNVISTNPDTKVAAFCNGQVRGVANLQYVQAYDRYEVFMNIYSNSTSGDSIYFNIYDGSTGLTYVTVDSSLTFVDNDVLGTAANPKTLSANTEISRAIPLNAGWTWVSFPLKSNRMTNSNLLLSDVSATNGDVSTSISAFDQYDSGLGWLGNISQSSGYFNNQSYKIKTYKADTIIHIGTRIHPDSSIANINVSTGWNWIGYISNKNMSITEAMGNYNAQTGDLLKSQYEFAYYDNLMGWVGSLTTMKPTMGYMLKAATPSTFNYPLSTYVGKAAGNNLQLADQSIFPFTPEQYSNTMSTIIEGNMCSQALDHGDLVLGAFDATNTLRGYTYPTKVNDHYQFYLTLYSNTDAENLNLKYFNTSDGKVISANAVLTFTTDALAGSPSSPITANADDSLKCYMASVTTSSGDLNSDVHLSVYPNPFTDNINIRFNKAVNVKVELVDVLGKIISVSSTKDKKEKEVSLDISKYQSLSAGVYYIRISGEVLDQIKVVKIK